MKRIVLALALAAAVGSGLAAQATYKLALYEVPTVQFYKDLFAEIAKVAGVEFDIQVAPPARADYLVTNGQVDIQAPHIKPKDPVALAAVKYDFGQYDLTTYCWVLFSNKTNQIDPAELKKGNPKKYVIETDTANVNLYGFTAAPSSSVEASLQKVNDGKIDGYIHSQTTTDAFAKKMSLSNCKRSLFEIYNATYTLPRGQGGGTLDKLMADALKKLKASGKYDQIMGKLNAGQVYNDWQP
jgi:polar amino acid transport system substrate-binding protein